MNHRFLRFLLALSLWAGALAWIVWPARHIEVDSDYWLPADHPVELNIQRLTDAYEPGESCLLIFHLGQPLIGRSGAGAEGGAGISVPNLPAVRAIEALEAKLKALPQVVDTTSAISAQGIFELPSDDPEVAGDLQITSLHEAFHAGYVDLAGWRSELHEGPYAGRLLSADGLYTSVLVGLSATASASAVARSRALEDIERVVQEQPLKADYLVGDAPLKAKLDDTLKMEVVPLLVTSWAITLVLTLLLTASLRRSLLVVFLASGCSLAALGFFIRFGLAFTPVALILPTLVLIVALADALHVLARWDTEKRAHPQDLQAAWRRTVRHTWMPCFSASLTTAAGCLSFASSELLSLSEFGLAATVAILLAYPLLILPLWGVLRYWPNYWERRQVLKEDSVLRRALQAPARFCLNCKPAPLAAFWVLGTAGLALGLVQARTESNFLEVFFATDSEMRQGFDVVDEELQGSGVLDLILDHPQAEHFRTLEGMQTIDHLKRSLKGLDSNAGHEVHVVDSYLLPISVAHRAFGETGELPTDEEALVSELFFLDLSSSDTERGVLEPWLNFGGNSARIRLITRNLDSQSLDELIDQSLALEPEGYSLTPTGPSWYIKSLSDMVLDTQLTAIATVLLMIYIILLVHLGPRWGSLGMLINVPPLLMTLGLISWLGLAFDFGTILVTSLTLGLTVDAALHLLNRARWELREGKALGQALESAVIHTARPIFQAVVVVAGGLLSLCLSEIVLIQRFALFSVFGVCISGLAAVTILLLIQGLVEQQGVDGRKHGN